MAVLLLLFLMEVVLGVVCETVGSSCERVVISPEEDMVGLMEMKQQFRKDIMRRTS